MATSNLGFCYLYGNGTKQDYESAFSAFSKAAVLGIGDAIVRLGDMYRDGLYVAQDEKAAFDMYRRARDMAARDLDDWGMQQVYSDAHTRLGDCYLNGIGTDVDKPWAIRSYGLAMCYYMMREERGDAYCSEGLKRTKEMLLKALELGEAQDEKAGI